MHVLDDLILHLLQLILVSADEVHHLLDEAVEELLELPGVVDSDRVGLLQALDRVDQRDANILPRLWCQMLHLFGLESLVLECE